MNITLISTYELGRQPFGLASPAAWLRARGHQVRCFDVSREPLGEDAVRTAGLIAFSVPMHTATRLAAELVARARLLNPAAHYCFFGLYAPVNEGYLRGLGVETVLGGEFEQGLADLAERLSRRAPGHGDGAGGTETGEYETQPEPVISLARQEFVVPDRSGMPDLSRYARVTMPDGKQRIAGSTEATRGCKHLCRHCPIVPVYQGAFRVVGREIVIEDVRRQVAAGARHISFGDPDFFNGPAHGLSIVEAICGEFPGLSYDVTIKVEHLRQHDRHLVTLRDTGCLFVTSAVESVDDAVLDKLDKGHTREDFLAVVARFRELGMTLAPTFVPFTPWTTLESYCELLKVIARENLTENVAPIQLAIRLLIPAGSRLLELTDVQTLVEPFDGRALMFPWKHPDARLDALSAQLSRLVEAGEKQKNSRTEIFHDIWRAAHAAAGKHAVLRGEAAGARSPSVPVPFLDEPWYCCAEPTQEQFVTIGGAGAAVSGADRFV